jgi:adenosine deaminase
MGVMMLDQRIKELITKIPKAENHIHLEGSITCELLLLFGGRNNIDLPFNDLEGARKYILDNTSSLDTFINVFNLVNSVLCNEDDFYELVMDYAKDANRQNIIYRETMISFAVHESRGIPFEVIINGVSKGRKEALEKYGVDIQFIAEIDRAKDKLWSVDFVNKIKDYKESTPIIAVGWELGLKGAEEDNNTAEEFTKAFKLAKEYGFYKTAHCGEAQGPWSVWDAINHLEVDRIDHGVQASKDKELVDYLADKKIPLTVCPSTNILCSLYQTFKDHPLNELKDGHVIVSINTDDPAYIFDDLISEYIKVAEAYDYSAEDIIELVRNSFEYSFVGKKYLNEVNAFIEKWDKGSL